MPRFNDVLEMTADERVAELAALLARAVLRLRSRGVLQEFPEASPLPADSPPRPCDSAADRAQW